MEGGGGLRVWHRTRAGRHAWMGVRRRGLERRGRETREREDETEREREREGERERAPAVAILGFEDTVNGDCDGDD